MPKINWINTLLECANQVQRQIQPLLKTLKQPQPYLGIGAGGDPIKKIDLAAENAIIKTLTQHQLSFTLISEESGVKEYCSNSYKNFVTVDPIDGTTNLMRGIPFYATSIAVSTKPTLDSVHAALVLDLFHKVTYTAAKEKGAYRNGEKITPSENDSLEEAVIGIDLNTYKIQKIIPQLNSLIKKTKHIRHLGANALELCYAADGTIDSFIDIRGKLRATDIAAAHLIMKEAGAIATTPEGETLRTKLSPKQKVAFVASGNTRIHKLILKMLKSKNEIKC